MRLFWLVSFASPSLKHVWDGSVVESSVLRRVSKDLRFVRSPRQLIIFYFCCLWDGRYSLVDRMSHFRVPSSAFRVDFHLRNTVFVLTVQYCKQEYSSKDSANPIKNNNCAFDQYTV